MFWYNHTISTFLHIHSDKDYFKIHVVRSTSLTSLFLKPDGTDLFHFVHGYATWPQYLTGMTKDGTWGDHLILRAAANCYETRIRVVSSLGNEVIIDPDHLVLNNNPLVLGHIHEMHYVSLLPLQGVCVRCYKCATVM